MTAETVAFLERATATVGHYTDDSAQTGCTVVLFDRLVPATVDVRGGAPGTREISLLSSGSLVQSVDAILLTGGSAHGLAAADGVMSFLRDQNRGVVTAAGRVPIVSAAVLYDLGVGFPVWPDASAGRAACESAVSLGQFPRGLAGAGRGATTRKFDRSQPPRRGGLGYASVAIGSGAVAAIVAVNALGEVGAQSGDLDPRERMLSVLSAAPEPGTATTLGVVVIDAEVDRRTLERCTIAAHDAFARAIKPSHTIFDGDTVFAVSLADGPQPPEGVLAFSIATELAVERAIIDAITA